MIMITSLVMIIYYTALYNLIYYAILIINVNSGKLINIIIVKIISAKRFNLFLKNVYIPT